MLCDFSFLYYLADRQADRVFAFKPPSPVAPDAHCDLFRVALGGVQQFLSL